MKSIQVLLSTYNGERYLDEQIESLIMQKDVKVSILVRDDGSSDTTVAKLKEWESKGVLRWYFGENLKPAYSFMDLIKNAPRADYYAFCDQDDVWDNDKLKIAVTMLEKFDDNEPALYFSNTRLVDHNLTPIKPKMRKSEISLGAALIINPATGCTEVFNHALINIIRKYQNVNIYMHDGWIYKLCMSINGHVISDKNAHISYRQHENNVVGGKSSIYKKYRQRVKNVLTERNRIREKEAKELIMGYSQLIPQENMVIIEKIASYRRSFKDKLNVLLDKNIRTNRLKYDFAFICSILLNAF